LRTQLITFFVFKPAGLLFSFITVVQTYFQKNPDYKKEKTLSELCEEEFKKPEAVLFDEYLQISLLFCAALCFAPVFPEGLIVAMFHGACNYMSDRASFFKSYRIPLPLRSDVYATCGWLTVWTGIGWIGVFVSIWLVRPFLKDPGVDGWNKFGVLPYVLHKLAHVKLDFGSPEVMWLLLLMIEHAIFAGKAYLQLVINLNMDDIQDHRGTVRKILRDRRGAIEEQHEDNNAVSNAVTNRYASQNSILTPAHRT